MRKRDLDPKCIAIMRSRGSWHPVLEMLRFSFVVFVILASTAASAQADGAFGRLDGMVEDSITGEPLYVKVQLAGTPDARMTDLEGRFSFRHVPVGTFSIVVQDLGYVPDTLTGIVI